MMPLWIDLNMVLCINICWWIYNEFEDKKKSTTTHILVYASLDSTSARRKAFTHIAAMICTSLIRSFWATSKQRSLSTGGSPARTATPCNASKTPICGPGSATSSVSNIHYWWMRPERNTNLITDGTLLLFTPKMPCPLVHICTNIQPSTGQALHRVPSTLARRRTPAKWGDTRRNWSTICIRSAAPACAAST